MSVLGRENDGGNRGSEGSPVGRCKISKGVERGRRARLLWGGHSEVLFPVSWKLPTLLEGFK